MRIVAVSDTHGFHEELDLPDGDVLVHTGDFCRYGSRDEVEEFLTWFAARPHRHKLFVAGNHDLWVERELAAARALVPPGVTFLHDSGVAVEGTWFWGAPWTPEFFRWAFMLPRGPALRARWDAIPKATEVLLTHGPPYGHGDLAVPFDSTHPRAVGCAELLAAVRRVRPALHVFGHIHEGYGVTQSDEVAGTRFANAATCTVGYEPTNPPLVLDLP